MWSRESLRFFSISLNLTESPGNPIHSWDYKSLTEILTYNCPSPTCFQLFGSWCGTHEAIYPALYLLAHVRNIQFHCCGSISWWCVSIDQHYHLHHLGQKILIPDQYLCQRNIHILKYKSPGKNENKYAGLGSSKIMVRGYKTWKIIHEKHFIHYWRFPKKGNPKSTFTRLNSSFSFLGSMFKN